MGRRYRVGQTTAALCLSWCQELIECRCEPLHALEKFNFPASDARLASAFLRRVGVVVAPTELRQLFAAIQPGRRALSRQIQEDRLSQTWENGSLPSPFTPWAIIILPSALTL
jgi:hypothetical protein